MLKFRQNKNIFQLSKFVENFFVFSLVIYVDLTIFVPKHMMMYATTKKTEKH